MRAMTFAAVVFLAAGIEPASAKCRTFPFRTVGGMDSTITMQASNGARCYININAHGKTAFMASNVSQQAKGGTAAIVNQTRVSYQSRPGFHGEDSFAFLLNSMSEGKSLSSTVRVTVTVD
jgi:hypothetical protein